MHYDGMTFRPPYEARSLLLQVTRGCSHNACTFCSMYRDVSFAISPLEEIVDDLAEAAWGYPYVSRVFLVNGDAFCLPADALLNIAEMIHEALPNVRSIGCYARIPNVTSKTDTELAALAAAGYDNINIGVESGLDDVLALMNKGFTVEEARLQFARLHAAGLPFNVNIINAAAGPKRILEHAAANAALVNEAKPMLIFVSPLHVDPGAPLEKLVARGDFAECTLGQYLEEEIAFLEGLELDDCVFFGAHVSNPVPVNGLLPRDKGALLAMLHDGLSMMPQSMRDSHPSKGAEGRLR
jgi:radical SAM superfamily enzyme YgiQ (UPF0313 family)